MKKWVEELKVGDKVIVIPQYGERYITKVKRFTKTLIITEQDSRFTKKWAQTPGNGRTASTIIKWTQDLEYSLQLKKKKKILVELIYDNLKKTKFSNMEIEELEKFLEQIKILKEKGVEIFIKGENNG